MSETPAYQLFDALPAHIEDALRASIERFCVLVPVVRDQHGNTIDGHHRARIADDLGVKYRIDVVTVSGEDEAREIAQHLNSRRRHLSGEQLREHIVMLAERTTPSGVGELSQNEIAQVAGVDQSHVNRVLNDPQLMSSHKLPESRRGADGKVRPSKRPTVVPAKNEREAERAQQALGALGEDAPASLVLDLKRVERAARDKKTESDRAAADVTPLATHDATILHCSVSELDLDADSVDLVFTDTPYPREYLPSWSDLAEMAAHALKPGGLLIAYSGQMFLPEVIQRLNEHLDYWWCYAITHVGAFYQHRDRRTQVGWKPVVVFRKPGDDRPPWVNDIVTDGVREKSGHHWQQSEAEAGYWIDKLTAPGDLVVDPFLGSGTTASVVKKLGRRFIGCDVDPLAVQRTKERIA